MKIKLLKKPFWTLEDGISQSFLTEFLSCRKRADLSLRQGWSTTHVSNPVTFGSLFHSALEKGYAYMRDGIKEVNWSTVADNCLEEQKKQMSSERIWTGEDAENHALNEGYLKILLPEYFKKYWKKDKDKDWFIIEQEFRNELPGLPPLRGKYDRICRNKNNEVWIYETKTKHMADPDIYIRLSYDFQAFFYMYNYWKQHNQLPAGFVYDIIQRPRLRKGAAETLKHFIDRVRGSVDDSYFLRVKVDITQEQMDSWVEKDFTPIIQEFHAWALKQTPTWRNPASCETRFGSCKFLKICGLKDYSGLVKRKRVFPELEEKKT